MIFTSSTSTSSGQSPLAVSADLFDLYSDENNNQSDSSSASSSALSSPTSTSPILAALMAAASSVAMASSQSDSGASIDPHDVVSCLPLTSFAIKHVLHNKSNATIPLPAPCLASSVNSNAQSPSIASATSLPSPALPLSTLNNGNHSNTFASKRARPDIRSVKRVLFVDKSEIDHEANLALVKEQLRSQSQANMKRWNFDFENGCPLPDTDDQNRFQWSPLLANAPTTCSTVKASVNQAESPVKRKISISDYFTTTKKMKILNKPSAPSSSAASNSSSSSSSAVDVKGQPKMDDSNCKSDSQTNAANRDLDVQVLCCISPKSTKKVSGSLCSAKRPIVRSRSVRRSKRLTTTARSIIQCKKQLNL